MQFLAGAVALLPKIDAQKNPLPAVLIAVVVGLLLWAAVGQARRRETRRSGGDGRPGRGPRPPRF